MARQHTFDVEGFLATLEEQAARKFDVLAPQPLLSAVPVDGTPTMELKTREGTTARLPWNRHAGNQIAQKLDLPRKHMTKMETPEHAAELCRHMNYWLERDDSRRLVRCIQTPDDPTSGAHIRAYLSDRYRILDNLDVATSALQAFVEKVQGRGGCPEVYNWTLSENAMDFLMIDTTLTSRLDAPEGQAGQRPQHGGHGDVNMGKGDWTGSLQGTIQDPDFEKRGTVARMAIAEGRDGHGTDGGSLVYPGVHIKNSETGESGYWVWPCALVATCSNRILIGQKVGGIHLGKEMNCELLYSRELMLRENAIVFEKIREAVKATFDPETFEKLLDTIRATMGIELPSEREAADWIIRRENWGEAQRDALLMAFKRQVSPERVTLFDAVQAITEAAQTFETDDPEFTLDMEVAAAGLVEKGSQARTYFGMKEVEKK